MEKFLLGIDRGTTNVKAALYNIRGEEILVSSQSCEKVKSLQNGFAEQNMEQIWKDTKKAIRRIWGHGICPEQIEAIGLSGQGGGLFLIDEKGVPTREGIVSLDSRVVYAAKEWQKNGLHQKFIKLWNYDNPTIPQALLYWLKEFEPEEYKRSRYILQCKDWIRYKLTNQVNYEVTDASNGFLINAELEYEIDFFDEYGIGDAKNKFPKLLMPWNLAGTVTEEAAEETGLLAGTKVAAGGHDVAMMVLGNGCYKENQIVSVLGTWGLNLLLVKNPHYMMTHYAKLILSASPDMYLLMNGASTGSSLEWFTETLCKEEMEEAKRSGVNVYKIIENKIMSEKNEAKSDVICHPFTEPLFMMPGYNNAQAGFYGMKCQTSREEILRAILEGVALEISMFLEVSKQAADKSVTLRLSGGGATNSLLGQMIADASNMRVQIMDVGEAGCRGAALSAGIAAGIYKNHTEVGSLPVQVKKEYFPDANNTAYMENKMKKFKLIAKAMEMIWNN